MRTWLAFLLLACSTRALHAQTATRDVEIFEINSVHSNIEFAVGFLGLTRVKGQFDEFRGILLYDARRPERSTVSLVIDAGSIHTGSALRDRHLKSADFLDVAKYPSIVFQSDGIVRMADGYRVSGRFTLHGTTRVMGLALRAVHPGVAEQRGVRYVDLEGTARVAWRDYGIAGTGSFNPWFQPEKMAVSDTLAVTLVVQADRRLLTQIHYARLDTLAARVQRNGVRGEVQRMRASSALGADSLKETEELLQDVAAGALESGRADDALVLFEFNVEAHPASAFALSQLGLAYWSLGRSAEARALFQRALVLDRFEPLALEMTREPAR